jgi:NAD(P)-dependent dehydrogenase (short-subunit alcohol dehydrogenase family)
LLIWRRPLQKILRFQSFEQIGRSDMQLGKDIVAVVTGGASGLGGATAKALAAKGAKVAIFDLNEKLGEALAAEIGGKFYKCDVSNEASIDAALAGARKMLGDERILVNCAGIGVAKRITRKNKETGAVEPHDLATFAKVINVNLVGTFLMMAKSSAHMQTLKPLNADGERGVMICTASVAAQDGQIGQVAYSASKGGVLAMTLPVARDLAQSGIRVLTIMPGLFHTPMFDGLSDDARRSLESSVPFPSRLGLPSEYAALAVHICENSMLNGEGIRLDGALRMAPR